MDINNLVKIKEGLAEIFIYSFDENSIPSKSMNVFYNQKMELNRDVTNLALMAYKKLYNQLKLIVVDSMAASGISSIRMIKECKGIGKIFINDINPDAVDLIHRNIKLNDINKDLYNVEISRKDANYLFLEIAQKARAPTEKIQTRPNVISIDPFGTPNIYIDAAFKAIQKENALMCITATDTAVLFGVRPVACLRKYMSKPLRTEYAKEIGARILIHFISKIANLNDLGILPVLTLYSNHFIRVFCITYKGKKIINKNLNKHGYFFHCGNCGNRFQVDFNDFSTPKKCSLCNNNKLDLGGPLWIGNIHNQEFIQMMILLNENFDYKNNKRIEKLLNFSGEEIDMPISYYNIHELSKILKLKIIPKMNDILQIIRDKGFDVSRTHFDFLSIKTNMNINLLKNCLVEFEKKLR
ncbi:MAG: tRNA (guanine(10)-N(2))-dimethyltransferase [Promethearchaeota archaeon]|nr:MAG: tRNA (guanine(10)-N(2))-dimethyltransferase [Candidatus Lokiarchaeota archaeon]